jgi:hypothetical protein
MAATLEEVYQVVLQAQVLHLFLVLLNTHANATLAKFGKFDMHPTANLLSLVQVWSNLVKFGKFVKENSCKYSK